MVLEAVREAWAAHVDDMQLLAPVVEVPVVEVEPVRRKQHRAVRDRLAAQRPSVC